MSWSALLDDVETNAELHVGPGHPRIQFFVGRNGAGKSRAAKRFVDTIRSVGGVDKVLYLSTDRLAAFFNYSGARIGSIPQEFRGAPLADDEIHSAFDHARRHGIAYDALHELRSNPSVYLRVVALLRRAFGRHIDLQEQSGFLNPVVRRGKASYSLLTDEGHGLRELVILLVSIYRRDWRVLVVDEPELHLHPSLVRLWISELRNELLDSDRHAIVVTHEPTLLSATTHEDLASIWVFTGVGPPTNLGGAIQAGQETTVNGALLSNPNLVGSLVFSPRPVLVEGPHDVAALTVAMGRSVASESMVQTDLVACGGSASVAAWYEIAVTAGLDVRAVIDLDALFESALRRAMDRQPTVGDEYVSRLHCDRRTDLAIRPVIEALRRAGAQPDPASRRDALLRLRTSSESADRAAIARLDAVLEIWRSQGVWLHPEGRLEDVLGLGEKASVQTAQAAAGDGALDAVAQWSAYELDPSGEVFLLLQSEVERIAMAIQRLWALEPEATPDAPVGASARADARIVDIKHIAPGRARLVVKEPVKFEGWSVEFDRSSAPPDLALREPT